MFFKPVQKTCAGFFVFKSIRMWSCMQKAIVVLAPSMFTIFMLHANEIGFGLMSRLEDFLLGYGLSIDFAFSVTAFVVFCTAFLLDIPRRCILAGLIKFGIIRA